MKCDGNQVRTRNEGVSKQVKTKESEGESERRRKKQKRGKHEEQKAEVMSRGNRSGIIIRREKEGRYK